jgi:rRNA maturation protein Rpf1
VDGWTLNVSRGGVRVVVEEAVAAGVDYLVVVGEAKARPARVVWVRDEADGQIVGLQFLDVPDGEVPGTLPPPPTSR